ncbi:MAG: hypothetical protein M3R50_08350 [Bacteroidota bacterium]|nr:hypothetical protein [Bacteroidota bacterium]
MERRFSMNDFEESLKEHADDFKMIPSKKVWHGIYNDLHPGRRWPSVAMSLLLIFTLVVVGHLNTHTGSHVHNIEKGFFSSENQNPETSTASANNPHHNISNNHDNFFKANNFKTGHKSMLSKQPSSKSLKTQTVSGDYKTNNSVIADKTSAASSLAANSLLSKRAINNVKAYSPNNVATSQIRIATPKNNTVILRPHIDEGLSLNIEGNNYDNIELNPQNNTSKYNTSKIDLPEKNTDLNNTFTVKPEIQIHKNENISSETQIFNHQKQGKNIISKQTIENKQLTKVHRKKNAKISWVFYAAPGIKSVSFSGQPIKQIANPGLSPAVAINQKQNRIIFNSSLGFEAGTQFNYGITKKLMFTVGLQATYSGYKIISNQVHPTLSTLLLKDANTGVVYSKNYLTHYGDGTGLSVVPLRNYSLQASLPLGLQYELFGNKKIQLSTAANFEPSLVLKSNGYILSSDGANYINDPSLLRKWNMSSNFGLFVTFHSSKFKWQIGPNVRYQWLSTYKKDYTVQEHLIDYGLRIAISK